MKIGIQVSSDLNKRTGVEEYIYQLLKHLPRVDDHKNHQLFLYNRKSLKWPFAIGWTQIGLSLKMLRDKPDVLFVPVHMFPIIHPKLVVAIQGLEFEVVPKTYSWLKRKILRFATKRNAKKADKIIVPSETTKNDLIKFYRINPVKIFVVYHGVGQNQNAKIKTQNDKLKLKNYILYLGSNHKRKNIDGIIEAFEILKEKYRIPHKLILAGLRQDGKWEDIVFMSYVDEDRKWELLKNADVFVFPSFYEGFGMPILEAQKMGVPVIASNAGALPEILGNSALLISPENPSEIAEAIYKVLSDEYLSNELMKKGYENAKRFSWLKCAEETLNICLKLQ